MTSVKLLIHIREGTFRSIENEALKRLFEQTITSYETVTHFNTRANPPKHSVSIRIRLVP